MGQTMSPTMITIGKVTIINNYRYTNTTCKIHPYQKAQVQCVDYKFGKITRMMIPSIASRFGQLNVICIAEQKPCSFIIKPRYE